MCLFAIAHFSKVPVIFLAARIMNIRILIGSIGIAHSVSVGKTIKLLPSATRIFSYLSIARTFGPGIPHPAFYTPAFQGF